MSQYTSDWAKLKTSDFICGCKSVHAYATSTPGADAFSADAIPSMSYNPSTGILTFKDNSQTQTYGVITVTAETRNTFVVWLGTVNGQ